jgi:hypothetical protein
VSSIWTPTSAQQELVREYTSEIMEQVHDDLEHVNKELRQIDPYTEVLRADPRATHPNLKPGYYHVIRRPPDGPPMIEVWEDPLTGEFKELGSDFFEWLRHSDLWSNRTRREREKRQKELKKIAEREKAAENADRKEELYQRIRSMGRTSISVPKGT